MISKLRDVSSSSLLPLLVCSTCLSLAASLRTPVCVVASLAVTHVPPCPAPSLLHSATLCIRDQRDACASLPASLPPSFFVVVVAGEDSLAR